MIILTPLRLLFIIRYLLIPVFVEHTATQNIVGNFSSVFSTPSVIGQSPFPRLTYSLRERKVCILGPVFPQQINLSLI